MANTQRAVEVVDDSSFNLGDESWNVERSSCIFNDTAMIRVNAVVDATVVTYPAQDDTRRPFPAPGRPATSYIQR